MVKRKQTINQKDSSEIVSADNSLEENIEIGKRQKEEAELTMKQQEKQATVFLKTILDPIKIQMEAQNKAIMTLVQSMKEIQERPAPSLIPPEIAKAIPDILNGIFKLFTTPETSPEAARQGIFDNDMMGVFKKKMMEGWDTDSLMKSETLRQLRLQNDRAESRLKDEY